MPGRAPVATLSHMRAWSWLPLGRLPSWTVLVITAVLVAVDILTGPYYQFPSVYIIFVVITAWFNGLVPGVVIAILLACTRVVLLEWYWLQPWDPQAYLATGATRMLSWIILAVMTARLAEHERALRTKVDTLVSLLPVCADCQRIRADDQTWQDLEAYASDNRERFAPALCPSCLRVRLPEHVPPTV